MCGFFARYRWAVATLRELQRLSLGWGGWDDLLRWSCLSRFLLVNMENEWELCPKPVVKLTLRHETTPCWSTFFFCRMSILSTFSSAVILTSRSPPIKPPNCSGRQGSFTSELCGENLSFKGRKGDRFSVFTDSNRYFFSESRKESNKPNILGYVLRYQIQISNI